MLPTNHRLQPTVNKNASGQEPGRSSHPCRIAVICPNPALDVTASASNFTPGDNIAGADITIRAGGKGTNVACVASDLGATAILVAPLGGGTGEGFEHMLDPRVSLERVSVSEATRLCLTLVDHDTVSEIRGRGPTLSDDEWGAFVQAAQDACSYADAAVVSGSFPPGIPAGRTNQLVSLLDCPRIYVDTSGAHLAAAADSSNTTIAPNLEELSALVGFRSEAPSGLSDRSQHAARWVAQLQQRGTLRVLATLGESGAGLLSGGLWHVAAPPKVSGNTVGAGDAALAAFIKAEATGLSPSSALVSAAATGAAAVAQAVAGRIQPEIVKQFESRTTLSRTALTDAI